ncbi:CBS domain-containing protein cbscbspb1, variant 2 [Stylosanthes scabra]|uniref:CBS domain-containing protein cbscbspb1, variant 2 n=1 Tax=Stylosanthes scabra TaxID=79078 RepID=A0ABU6Z4Y7_9FABA|nr:CBS domain-containing protein cbscbspb1, variant 2 [Stylosanthes scabra]
MMPLLALKGRPRKERQLQQLLKVSKNTGDHLLLDPIPHSWRLFGIRYSSPLYQQSFLRNQSRVIIVSPTDTVLATTKKMLELRVSCAVVTVDDKPCGILTSKDILMRVIAQNLPASTTLVEKAMTPNPECAKVDTPIVDALHTMQDGKFLHLPVLDKDGTVVAILDVIHITHAAIATAGQVGNTANLSSEAADSMIQKFWDSAISLSSPNDDDDEDSRSDSSLKIASEGREIGRSAPFNAANMLQQAFSFKVQDRKGRLHRFTCDTRSLTEVVASISQKVGNDIDADHYLPQIMYEDEEHDKIVLASDSDLAAAVEHAKTAGLKGLRLHLEYSRDNQRDSSVKKLLANTNTSLMRPSTYSVVAAGAVILAGLSILAFFRRR